MANSVTARFNDDCKVFVSMSDDTTVEKAVIIDAEGNETDIGGGGGSSDFSTGQLTIINSLTSTADISMGFFTAITFGQYDLVRLAYKDLEPNSTSVVSNALTYKGYISVMPDSADYSISGEGVIDLSDEYDIYLVPEHGTITVVYQP